MREQGLRYNTGKLRMELIPTQPLIDVAEVYTKGAHKYSIYEDENGNRISGADISFEEVHRRGLKKVYDGADNWRKGLPFRDTIAAVKRHIARWEMGEEYDEEFGTKNLAHAIWGLNSLLEFSRTKPHFDDRILPFYNTIKVGFDIDEVLADWVGAWIKRFGYKNRPDHWKFSYDTYKEFEELKEKGEIESFYLSIPPKIDPRIIPFEPHCYITSRSVPVEITKKWLQVNGFPTAPVYSVGFGKSKLEAAKESGIDVFIDDSYDHFIELNANGILTYLMDAPHNQKYDVGPRRIYTLRDLPWLKRSCL